MEHKRRIKRREPSTPHPDRQVHNLGEQSHCWHIQSLGNLYPEGYACVSHIAKGDSMLVLHCGHPRGGYVLSKPYAGNVQLEWDEETTGPANVSGEVVQ